MNPFQIVILVLASLLAVSVFWDKIKKFASKYKDSVTDYELVETKVEYVDEEDSALVNLVRCWEHLKINCEKEQLKDACEELDKIFPLFVPKGATDV